MHFFLITSPLHLAVLHFILLVLVQTINCANCALSELSKLSFTVTSIVESLFAYLTIDTSSRLLSVSRSSKKQIEEMRSTHTTLHCSFTDHHPITHRTVVYQPLLSIRQETNIPVNTELTICGLSGLTFSF